MDGLYARVKVNIIIKGNKKYLHFSNLCKIKK
jgi:hypothetical protein